jgi:hypothetical protein
MFQYPCGIWCSHSGGYEEYYLLGYNAVQSVEIQPTFRRNISPSFLGSKYKPSLLCLPPAFMLLSFSAYTSNLKKEVICSSETSIKFQRTTWRNIPEDSALIAVLFNFFFSFHLYPLFSDLSFRFSLECSWNVNYREWYADTCVMPPVYSYQLVNYFSAHGNSLYWNYVL